MESFNNKYYARLFTITYMPKVGKGSLNIKSKTWDSCETLADPPPPPYRMVPIFVECFPKVMSLFLQVIFPLCDWCKYIIKALISFTFTIKCFTRLLCFNVSAAGAGQTVAYSNNLVPTTLVLDWDNLVWLAYLAIIFFQAWNITKWFVCIRCILKEDKFNKVHHILRASFLAHVEGGFL